MENVATLPRKDMLKLPKTSGVYFFYKGKSILYIGKAINIKERVRSHFQQPSYRDNLFISQVTRLGYQETNSEIEALVLEASLIKKHLPKFNVLWKDDKNYFYVAFEKNNLGLPFVSLTHQSVAQDADYIGPFVEGGPVKKALKYLRNPFPYYSAKNHPKAKCPWCHIDRCPGPNPDVQQYQKNITKLKLILEGKRSRAATELEKEMKAYSRAQDYENAKKVRDQWQALDRVLQHTHVLTNAIPAQSNGVELLQRIIGLEAPIQKIECYDISNIQGKQAVGSMVVFAGGHMDKSQYKKFKIRMEEEPNDIAMLKEVFSRRLEHPEWGYPEVMLIDGGIAQLNAAIAMKSHTGVTAIKVISIAKGKKELFIEGRKYPIALKLLPQSVYNIIVQLDDEAHRFALTYHKKLRKKKLLEQ